MKRILTRGTLAVALTTALLANEAAAQTAPFVISDGTPVRLRLRQNISSADAQVGQTVDFELIDEIIVNGITVAPRGAAALATVTDAKAKGRLGKGGRLNVNIDHLRLASGEKTALRAVKDVKGGGHTGAMTGAIVATSLVFFPAAPLFLLMKGKDITIPQGTQITAYVNGEVKLDMARFTHQQQPAPAYAGPAAPQAQPQPASVALVSYQQQPTAPAPHINGYAAARPGMTNDDVVDLKAAGFSDEVIISKIKTSAPAFRVETNDLMRLKRQGVSQPVIAAMIERGGAAH
jgi:hypothetical protein